jgi:hypothetical protein
MNFHSFLLIENLIVNAAPGLEEYAPQAKMALAQYLQRYGNNLELKSSSKRFNYTLTKYQPDTYYGNRFYFKYDAIDKGKGNEEIITDKSDWRYEYDKDWNGKTNRKVYKTPKDAIESIPDNPSLAYRGMSWEEWQNIQKTGYVQSFGQHNFSNQTNLTFYGPKPATGEAYAGGFAPKAYAPTPKKPGIVIAVPRNLLKTPKDNPNIPNGELASEKPINAHNITNVWMLIVIKIKPGTFDLEIDRNGKVKEGSRSSISMSYAIRQLK